MQQASADNPHNTLSIYRSALTAGSDLVLSHLASGSFPAEDQADGPSR